MLTLMIACAILNGIFLGRSLIRQEPILVLVHVIGASCAIEYILTN